jgi:Ni/Co efflux regulator RcnB
MKHLDIMNNEILSYSWPWQFRHSTLQEYDMKKIIAVIAAFSFASSAFAAPASASASAAASAPKNPQQSKMATCNTDAAGKKGDERKAFMKECLSAKPAAPATQQSKMKTCNADAAGKKGDERKAFMKECLSAKK